MKSFEINQVKLVEHNFLCRQEKVKDYVLEFDINRLMHNFRINAGIESDASPLGGWEAPDCALRGHFVGHFLSACAKLSYGTGDFRFREKAEIIVEIMGQCAKANGYLSAFDERELDILEEKESSEVWAPYYTLHKILNGLVQCAKYLNNNKALKLAENLALYIHGRFSKLSDWKTDSILRCVRLNPVNEFGGIGESLYDLWELTNNTLVLELAKLFDREYFVGNLSRGKDILTDLHANTHLAMINSCMRRYEITKEVEYKNAGINFYQYLLSRTFANGNSSSRAEHFVKGGVSEQAEHWGKPVLDGSYLTGGEGESCCAHNTEKLLEYLLKFDKLNRLQYLNHLEILKYNAVVNCASQRTGLSQYHQPLGVNKQKKFSSKDEDFWCCTGSGLEAMAELQKNIWLYDDDAIYLNMFVASELKLNKGKTTLQLETDYPKSDKAIIIIHTQEEERLKLVFRENAVEEVKLNGNVIIPATQNGFSCVDKIYRNNDQIEITIKTGFYKASLGTENNIFCIMYGNILLAQTEGNLLDNEILERASTGEFVGKNCKFIPLYMIEDEKYTVYLNSQNTVNAMDGSSAYVCK